MKKGDAVIQRVPLKLIVPNRYRHFEQYRISDVKVEALIQSYENSGFWDGSIQARPIAHGKFEIAFGHHRIEAAKRFKSAKYPDGLTELGLVVAPRSDADMLRMMADENREEFKGDHLVAVETIAATIEAYDRGELDGEMPPVPENTPKSQIYQLRPGGRSYTLATIARFLSWTRRDGEGNKPRATHACELAFAAYHQRANIVPALAQLPEDERTKTATAAVLTAVKTAGRVATRAGRSATEVRAAEREAAARTVKEISQGKMAAKTRDRASQIGAAVSRKPKAAPDLHEYVRTAVKNLQTRSVNFQAEIGAVCSEVMPYVGDLDDRTRTLLLDALEQCGTDIARALNEWKRALSGYRSERDITPRRRALHA